MEPRDIKLSVDIKNYKVGKYLHLFATEAISDFQKTHPQIIPDLLLSLKTGNPRQSLETVIKLEECLDVLHNSIKYLKSSIEEYMVSELGPKEAGKGDQFITTDGGMGFSFKKGEEKVIVKQGSKNEEEDIQKTSPKTIEGGYNTLLDQE